MAITHDYVDYGAGNDYKGASFTDGAFTVADMTLTKAGAFAASSVGHWLYLDDNGSGEVTTGYYRITDVTGAPNAVVLHADIRSGANDPTDVKCTQHDGTALLPWRSVQGACDLLTRNTTDGNQINVKSSTAQVNAAAIDLDEVIAGGALAAAAPLIIRGYTTAANDGGIGEIDCGGAAMFAATLYNYIVLMDLKIHNGGNNHLVYLGGYCQVIHCELTIGASTPTSKYLLALEQTPSTCVGNWIHDAGTTGNGVKIVGGLCAFNHIEGCDTYGVALTLTASTCCFNIISASAAGAIGIWNSGGSHWVFNNAVYNSAAGTNEGIETGGNTAGRWFWATFNNIVEGWSGASGIGIGSDAAVYEYLMGYNAFYNNAANHSTGDVTFIDKTANDIALAASPFTDPSNGDFSLTAAAKTALADKGFPVSFYGAHANSTTNLNIGPIQLEAGGSAGVIRRVARLLGG